MNLPPHCVQFCMGKFPLRQTTMEGTCQYVNKINPPPSCFSAPMLYFKWILSSQNSLRISDIHNSALFHQTRHFNCVKFIFHLHSVLSYYWSVSDASSCRKKQKFINSLPLAHLREKQVSSGKRIFLREMKHKILFQNVYTLHTYMHTYEEERGRRNTYQKILIAHNVATITWRLLSWSTSSCSTEYSFIKEAQES